MAVDTEEEQIEKIEKIWRTHKRLIIMGIIAFLAIYFSYDFYLDKNIQNAERASQTYQEILVEKITNINLIKEKVSQLKENSRNTPYASRSAIYLSKLYSKENKNEEAISELIWASENAIEDSIQSMAYYLLANIYYVTNKLNDAMESAKKVKTVGYQTLAKDIIGDIYFKQGNKEEAKKYYLEGLKLYKGQGDIRKVLQNKIDSIGQ